MGLGWRPLSATSPGTRSMEQLQGQRDSCQAHITCSSGMRTAVWGSLCFRPGPSVTALTPAQKTKSLLEFPPPKHEAWGFVGQSSGAVQTQVLTDQDSPWLPCAKKELLGQLPLQGAPVSEGTSWDPQLRACVLSRIGFHVADTATLKQAVFFFFFF